MSKHSSPKYEQAEYSKFSEFPVPEMIVEDTSTYSSFSGSYINLLKTIIGAGILVLPFALVRLGLILGLLMMFLAGSLCALGLHLLSVSAAQLGRKASFSGLCSITYPQTAFIFEFAIAIKCIGAGISYLTMAGDTVRFMMKNTYSLGSNTFVPSWISELLLLKPFWVIFFATILTPICMMRKMDSLKYTSFAGIAAVLYLVVLTVWNFFTKPDASFSLIPLWPQMSYSTCSAYSVFVFAFTCHQNILPIQNEARRNSPKDMMSVVSSSVMTSGFLYLVVSIFGTASYGPKISNKILDSFPSDQLAFIIARFMYVFLLVLSFPLQLFPCRICIEKMTSYFVSQSDSIRLARSLYWASTIGIISICTIASCMPISIDKILSWVGATAGTFICYLLPGIIYNKLHEHDSILHWRRISALVLLFAGLATLLVSIFGLLWG